MNTILSREQLILLLLIEKDQLSSSEIAAHLVSRGLQVSAITVKRTLAQLATKGSIHLIGVGRSTQYQITSLGRLLLPIDAHAYCDIEPDKRVGLPSYNHSLFSSLPPEIFSAEETEQIQKATDYFKHSSQGISPVIANKEMERLVIELAWKSSRIEGNTYSLLDTERLLRENKYAQGHDAQEAQMILNHRNAFTFITEHSADFRTFSQAHIEQIHKLLVQNMGVESGFRKKVVGISGSKYRPLETIYQIEEAMRDLEFAINRTPNPLAKALLAILGISYIQPFEDGNKRTARLTANAILLAYQLMPLSYRSVDESSYKESIICFYELNTIVPFKQLFISQYDFASRNYLIDLKKTT